MTGPVTELLKEFGRSELDQPTVMGISGAFDAVGIRCDPGLVVGLDPRTRLSLWPVEPGASYRNQAEAHATGAGATVLVSTTFEIPGYETVAFRGEVFGLVVRSRDVVSNFGASAKALVGGELRGLSRLLVESRNDALARMRAQALARGANAVVGLRYDSAEIGGSANEVVAYGTAITVRKTGGLDQSPE